MKPTRRTAAFLILAAVLAATGFQRVAAPTATGEKMSKAAVRFVDSLSAPQRIQTVLAYDLEQRTDWHYIPKPTRKGLQVKEMNDAQRGAAFELLKTTLSAVGYEKATKIMQLESLLRELEKSRTDGPIRDPERYYFTVFDQPNLDTRWGLSIEGHHLSLNFVIDGGKVVSSTPTFFGANPGVLAADYGKGLEKGLRVLAGEEQLAFDLLNSLSEEQRKTAIIADKAPSDVRGAGKSYPPMSAATGLAASDMTPAQVAKLRSLIETYAANLPEETARERMAAIERDGIEGVKFTWQGADKPGIGHDYRVQGKSFLIEFNNTQPDAAGNLANHVHCVWHDLKGNFAVPVE